ncbi:MAG: DUF2231 domain-containing protein [Armatimonadetes bacterium]|nr:DUF2231 domain-containing protein [Armatimonadota bacterium]
MKRAFLLLVALVGVLLPGVPAQAHSGRRHALPPGRSVRAAGKETGRPLPSVSRDAPVGSTAASPVVDAAQSRPPPVAQDETSAPAFTLIELHMAAAHFPIGLLLSSVFFDLVGWATRKRSLRETAFWTHLLGVGAAAATVALGLMGNPFRSSEGEVVAAVARHQWAGISGLAIFGLLVVWRVRRRNELDGFRLLLYSVVALAGVVAVCAAGYLGSRIMG